MSAVMVLCRRLDVPGHDACRVDSSNDGHHIEGGAAFLHHDGEPAWLGYDVVCDAAWRSRCARVRGWIGAHAIDLVIDRAEDGRWRLGGSTIPHIGRDCDLDLGFTPATNVIAVRRLALAIGQATDAAAAWLDPSDWSLETLAQRYRRDGEHQYRYEAPTLGFATTLSVTRDGMIKDYPPFWRLENEVP